MRKTRLYVPFAAAVALSVLAACGGSSSGSGGNDNSGSTAAGGGAATSVDDLYQRAKAEGTVTLWMSTAKPGEVKAIQDGFAKKFPGIKVVVSQLTQTDVTTKVVAEEQAGQVDTDLIVSSADSASPLLERNLLLNSGYVAKLFNIPSDKVLEGGRQYDFYDNLWPLGYNKTLINSSEVPKTWDDLVNSKWKGKVLVEDRGMAFIGLGMTKGEDYMTSYIKRFREAVKPVLVNGGTPLFQELAAGQAPLALGGYLFSFLGPGVPSQVGYVLLSPTWLSQNTLSIVKDAPHPSAAALLLGWVLSPDGLAARAKATASSSALDAGSLQGEAVKAAGSQLQVVVGNVENQKKASEMKKAAAAAMGVGSGH